MVNLTRLITVRAITVVIENNPITLLPDLEIAVQDDERRYVDLTTFGFFKGGILDVKMVDFMMPSGPVYGEIRNNNRWITQRVVPCMRNRTRDTLHGSQLPSHRANPISPYLAQSNSATCYLKESDTSILSPQHPAIVFLKMDFKNLRLNVTCKAKVLHLYENRSSIPDTIPTEEKCSYTMLPITKETRNGFDYYNTSVEIYESNAGNFLSAGEMPLPALYSMMSLIFLTCAALWTFILRTSRQPVYRIHIIMCVLVYLKALSLAFHGINYHFIQTKGEHVTAWAILFYITHLLKGAVLFVTIVLVGTGWNFIKHILSDRDKKLFMIVIPLQVLANVAEIILAESEEGAAEHNAWRDIFVLVELLCCWAIMFPVVCEEGAAEHNAWRDIFVLVELLCCWAIMFPVVWYVLYSTNRDDSERSRDNPGGERGGRRGSTTRWRDIFVLVELLCCWAIMFPVVWYVLYSTNRDDSERSRDNPGGERGGRRGAQLRARGHLSCWSSCCAAGPSCSLSCGMYYIVPIGMIANVAEIILAESEEGAAEHNAWRDIFVLVELLCCWAIMFPVVWYVLYSTNRNDSERSRDNPGGERGGRRGAQRVARHLRAGRAAVLLGHHVPCRVIILAESEEGAAEHNAWRDIFVLVELLCCWAIMFPVVWYVLYSTNRNDSERSRDNPGGERGGRRGAQRVARHLRAGMIANVAEIILAESEEGAAEHNAWRDIFVLVELLCCWAIMFPVVWYVLYSTNRDDSERSRDNPGGERGGRRGAQRVARHLRAANVAEIILAESEEGAAEHNAWRDIFVLVELLCCWAIMFPSCWYCDYRPNREIANVAEIILAESEEGAAEHNAWRDIFVLDDSENVAEIILAESEEGAAEHNAWRDIFVLVELLCCWAIMFPVVWRGAAEHNAWRDIFVLVELLCCWAIMFPVVWYVLYSTNRDDSERSRDNPGGERGWRRVRHNAVASTSFVLVELLCCWAIMFPVVCEEGAAEHNAWRRHLVVLVELLCCWAIMFPVVWYVLYSTNRDDSERSRDNPGGERGGRRGAQRVARHLESCWSSCCAAGPSCSLSCGMYYIVPIGMIANVAEIILAESEEGAAEHNAWRDIFVLVELLCCWAIMFPVVWSIRHLQDASSTDGKAAINLRKLKLFRHFYVMVVCYIYFTRIVISILNITVPFQYAWIDEMFREMATLAFFVMTGYKFRPAAANPYFTPTHVDDVEPQVLSDIGVLEGVTRIANRGDRKREDLQPLMQETNYNSD
ncbi:hypothetical protein SFRURICE_010966 [Spodoptera frugiperda]|nr:hypothetical protein SFRURICE_010966 [Spodoptera frugiperda]